MKIYVAFDNDSIENKLIDVLSTNHKCVGAFKGSVDSLYEALLSKDYELLVLRESVFKESDSLKILQKLVKERPNIRIVYVVKDRALGDEYLFECAKMGIYDILNGLVNIKSIIKLIETKNQENELDYFLTPSQINEIKDKKVEIENVQETINYETEKDDLSFDLLDTTIEFEDERKRSETPILDKIIMDNQESRDSKRNELDHLFELVVEIKTEQNTLDPKMQIPHVIMNEKKADEKDNHDSLAMAEQPTFIDQEQKVLFDEYKKTIEKVNENLPKYPIILYCVAHPLISHTAQIIVQEMKAICIDTDVFNIDYNCHDYVVNCTIDKLIDYKQLAKKRKYPLILNVNLNQTSSEVLKPLLFLADKTYLEVIQNDPNYSGLMQRHDWIRKEGLIDKVVCAYYEEELESLNHLQKRTSLDPILIRNSRKSEILSRNNAEFVDCIDTKRLLKEMIE